MLEYHAESKWCGFFGGWGSEQDIATLINRYAAEGWRLASTKNIHALWFWLLPRPKLLLLFERQRSSLPVT
jgi:hypothetical protein